MTENLPRNDFSMLPWLQGKKALVRIIRPFQQEDGQIMQDLLPPMSHHEFASLSWHRVQMESCGPVLCEFSDGSVRASGIPQQRACRSTTPPGASRSCPPGYFPGTAWASSWTRRRPAPKQSASRPGERDENPPTAAARASCGGRRAGEESRSSHGPPDRS